MKQILRLSFKDTFRSRNSALLAFGILFSFLVPIVIFTVSNSFMNGALEKSFQVYGYFDDILYHAEKQAGGLQNTRNDIKEAIPTEGIEQVGTVSVFRQDEAGKAELTIGYMDEAAIDLSSMKLLEGRLPQHRGELALCNSLIYQFPELNKLGETITVGDQSYTLVGLISDYSARWEKPKNGEALLPNALISLEEAQENPAVYQRHLLLDTSTAFGQADYHNIPNLVANANRAVNDRSEKYTVPTAVVILTSICSFFLNIYIFTYFIDSQQRKLAIFRCLNMTKADSVAFILFKIVILLVLAIPLGLMLGYGISWIAVFLFNRFIGLDHSIALSGKAVGISIFICVVTVFLGSLWSIRKINRLSPISLFSPADTEQLHGEKSSGKKYRKTGLSHLAFLDLKSHLKKSIIVALLIACCLSLFNFYSVYIKIFSSQMQEGRGEMSHDFDYEFLTNQSITDTSYVDDQGDLNRVVIVPDDQAKIYVPDYKKIISNDITDQLKRNPQIRMVNEYLDSNELYLLDAPSAEEDPYNSCYMNDAEMNASLKDLFNITLPTRSVQYLGYSEEELKSMEQYVMSGSINVEKIRSGEEVILMVPTYEFVQMDGYSQQNFLTPEEYTGVEGQFKESHYAVGDVLHLIQLVPKNTGMNGYITEEQARSNLVRKDASVKIGAIIYQRIAWFDTLSVPPMAYTLIGANESFQSLNIAPTHSRIRISLKQGVSYQDFEPEIQYYAGLLKGFDFRNNVAEQEEFRELQIILKVLYQTLVGMMALVIIIILIIEERIELFSKRKYYALLRLNGLSLPRLKGLIALKSVYFALCGILLSVPAVYATIQIVFGKMDDIATFINPLEILCSFLLVFVVTLCTSVTSIRYLKKHGITQLMFD